jgi:hypothetical protein
MKRLIAVALFAFACGSRTPPAPTGAGGSSAGMGAAPRGPCEAMRARVEQLYRAEAQGREPARVDEAVADNTALVMNDCDRAPDKVAACVAAAATVEDLEARCLAPIDDEGTEGDKLAR